jgi:ketosteroid isomerase-like protein
MYHYLARRRIERMFAALSNGDFEPALAGLAPRFEQVFAGDHPLGGSRHTVASFRLWFQRMYRLFPNLAFHVTATAASGPPWNMTLVAEWIDRATPADGGPYENRGVHVLRLRWGRIVSIHAYLDTQIVAETSRRLAAKGVSEAGAAPILS